MVQEIHIYDLDGTVIDSSHRYRTIRNPDGSKRIDLDFWRKNSHLAVKDSLLPLAYQMRGHIDNPACAVIIATARVMAAADWLFMRHNFNLDKLAGFCYRPEGSTEKGAVMKLRQVREVIREKNLNDVSLRWFYEDNLEYLSHVSYHLGAVPVYIPSKQGY